MGRKSSALRLAPPTNAPFTWVMAKISCGIARLDRAAIKDGDVLTCRAKDGMELSAQSIMDFGDFSHSGNKTRANGPNWLIGNDDLGIIGQGAGQLRQHDLKRLTCGALLLALTKADDGREPGLESRLGLGAHQTVALAIAFAPLGVAKDDIGGTAIGQLRGADVAGEGT